jgi:hypothetical protein
MPTNIATILPHATIAGLAAPTVVTIPDVLKTAKDGLTALAGGAQAGTALVGNGINRFTTVTTAGDSAQLPASVPGTEVIVINATATSMNVFGQTGDAINAVAGNGAYALATTKVAHFYCTAAGRWHSLLTA